MRNLALFIALILLSGCCTRTVYVVDGDLTVKEFAQLVRDDKRIQILEKNQMAVKRWSGRR